MLDGLYIPVAFLFYEIGTLDNLLLQDFESIKWWYRPRRSEIPRDSTDTKALHT